MSYAYANATDVVFSNMISMVFLHAVRWPEDLYKYHDTRVLIFKSIWGVFDSIAWRIGTLP